MLRLLLFFCFSLSYTVIAQDRTILYNYKTHRFGEKPEIREGETVQLKIENLNLYLYKVSANISQKTFNQTPPKLIKDFIDIGISGWPEIMIFSDKQNSDAKQSSAFPPHILNSSSKKGSLDALVASYTTLLKAHKEYQQNLLLIKDSHCIQCKVGEKKMDDIKRNLDFNLTEIKKIEFLLGSVDINKCSDDEKLTIGELQKIDLDALTTDLKQSAILELNLSNKNFNFQSIPIIAEGDEITFRVYISPRKTEDIQEIPLRTDSLIFKIPVRQKGINISFSTGLFASSNKNQTYSYKSTFKNNFFSDIDYYTLIKESESRNTLGINSLAHAMIYVGRDISLGIHSGIGLPLEKKANVYAFFGVSGALGKKNRVLLNFGRCGGFANQLSASVDLNQRYKDTALAIPYIRTFVGSWNTSLTFNFYSL